MKEQELRELDAWIAEHVMGVNLKEASWYCPRCRESVEPIKVTHGERHDIRAGGCGEFVHCDFPAYTTDPASAMEVLKKCIERDKTNDSSYQLNFSYRDKPHPFGYEICCGDFCEDADTLEQTICLFAKNLFSK